MIRILSFVLSVLSVGAILYIDLQIANRYNEVSGKTKALFALTELLQFGYKYYVLIPAIISILLALQALRLKDFHTLDTLSMLLSLIAIVATLTASWRLFI